MQNASEYNEWVRKTIMEEGMASFAQCPIPNNFSTNKCQNYHLPLVPAYQTVNGKVIDVLMTAILNIMTKEAVV